MKLLSRSCPEIFIVSWCFTDFTYHPSPPMSPARHCAKIAWASRVLPGPNLWVKWRELRDEHQGIPVWPIWHNKTPQHNMQTSASLSVERVTFERNRNSSQKVLSPQHSITLWQILLWVKERLRLAKLVSATDHTCPFDLTTWLFIPITLPPQIPLRWQTIVSKSHLLFPTTTRKKWQNKKQSLRICPLLSMASYCWRPCTWNGFKKTM